MTVNPSENDHLLRVQVFVSVARNVLCESIYFKTLAHSFEDDVF